MYKKLNHTAGQILRLFIMPLAIQIAAVHLLIGIYVSNSLLGRQLLFSESAMIAVAITLCQIVNIYTVPVRAVKKRKHENIRMVRSEVIR